MSRTFSLAVVASVFAGCSTYAAGTYAASADDVAELRGMSATTISVGGFTSTKPGQSEVTCRGAGPVKAPGGEPFSEYVRGALVEELTLAGTYAATAPITLTGKLDSIDFTSTSPSSWRLHLTLTSSNGRQLTTQASYTFKTSYFGERACNKVAEALAPAVQELIKKTVHAPEIRALVSPDSVRK